MTLRQKPVKDKITKEIIGYVPKEYNLDEKNQWGFGFKRFIFRSRDNRLWGDGKLQRTEIYLKKQEKEILLRIMTTHIYIPTDKEKEIMIKIGDDIIDIFSKHKLSINQKYLILTELVKSFEDVMNVEKGKSIYKKSNEGDW